MALVVGVPMGVAAALRHNSGFDLFTMSMAVFGISMPVFWIGLMLMLVFSVYMGILPAMGKAGLSSYVLPSLTLAANSMALIARMTRSSMLEVLRQDYVRTARAKGLSERSVIYKHALKNAMIPVVTVVGMQFGYLLGGAVLTETVFVWPGLGWYIANAVFHRDFPVVQAGILLVVISFVLVNLVVDLAYSYLDPRIALR
jgi:ABC-type dipeptide/oligopeptide/nickel transport system permease component